MKLPRWWVRFEEFAYRPSPDFVDRFIDFAEKNRTKVDRFGFVLSAASSVWVIGAGALASTLYPKSRDVVLAVVIFPFYLAQGIIFGIALLKRRAGGKYAIFAYLGQAWAITFISFLVLALLLLVASYARLLFWH